MASVSYPAAHPAAPQVAQGPGSVLANPNFIPVFFAGDDVPTETAVEDFVGKLGASTYWSTVTSEYGVGGATAGTAVILTQTAPATLDGSTIPAWIDAQLAATPPTLPTPDANTIYVLHYPASTTITLTSSLQGTSTSCVDFGGFHQTAALADNSPVAYAVIPRCAKLGDLTGLDELTGAESHELVEAATDPTPTQTGAAYDEPDPADLFWELGLGGGEVGDMCAQNPAAFYKDTALGYTVQRIWSNKAAAASHDPCVPAPQGEVYFNAVPNPGTTVQVFGIDMNGVSIPVGQSKTIEVDLFSDAATAVPITVKAVDVASAMGQAAELSFSWDKTTGVNGDKLHLTIKSLVAGQLGGSDYVLVSAVGTEDNLWVGLVAN